MTPKAKLAAIWAVLLAAILAVLACVLVLVVQAIPEAERARVVASVEDPFGLGLLVFLALFALTGLVARALVRSQIEPLRRLIEGARIQLSANPSHRVELAGSAENQEVGRIVNAFAERYETLQRDVEARIHEANAGLEEERNRLAALMSELTQSVLVCNVEGRILLYNQRARQLLSGGAEGKNGSTLSGLVGLGRSVFGVIDRNLVVHALENVRYRIDQGDARPLANFVATSPNGTLIRAQMVPVFGQEREISGFVLTVEDIKRSVEMEGQRDDLLQSLTQGTRASLATIRAAVENMLAFPEMDADRRSQFTHIISDEAGKLSGLLDQKEAEYARAVKGQSRLEPMLGSDLISAVQRSVESRLDMHTNTEEVAELLWLNVDSYTLVQAITYLATRLREEIRIRDLRFRLCSEGRLAHLDLIWSGGFLSVDTILAFENDPFTAGGFASPLTLNDVVARHGGEAFYQFDRPRMTSCFRLLLPRAEAEQAWAGPTPLASRPEYYDFDLFHQPGQSHELDDRLLSDLTYTVFDSETTGLEPSAGDEIIQIGAVRILNGRLLQQEAFDHFINPRRPMSKESIKITGITPEMLATHPTADQVLPAFHRFCEDTVLVAHNAAFDMRFLQLKEASTGVRFTQPVLDTLLLSAVLHEDLQSHQLEAIAERLGVNVIGRHTALGDAIVTGEAFLKMIPLLAEKGVLTLKHARDAAEKTFYARVKY
ncbi:MAG: DNA polymerase III subunit epsilon [Burkholderiales bacterium]|nr:DNA polymerase III subunit epsilon [Burkholderiales bacterium]